MTTERAMTLEQIDAEMDVAFNGRVVATQFRRWHAGIKAALADQSHKSAWTDNEGLIDSGREEKAQGLRVQADAIDAHLRAEPDYWAAVADDGEVEFAVGSDDTDADRTEVNQYINDRLLNDKKKLRLVAMYTDPPAQAQDARDAARWRKVRHMGVFKPGPPMECGFVFNESADAVVDNAMAREGE